MTETVTKEGTVLVPVKTELPVAKTRREADPAGFKRLHAERRQRRKSLRALGKKNKHKPGHNTRVCKLCGASKVSFDMPCPKAKA